MIRKTWQYLVILSRTAPALNPKVIQRIRRGPCLARGEVGQGHTLSLVRRQEFRVGSKSSSAFCKRETLLTYLVRRKCTRIPVLEYMPIEPAVARERITT